MPRGSDVHSAERWDAALPPEIDRQQKQGKDVVVHADAAFAKPDLYDRALTLEFVSRIRAEMKFPGVEALKSQVQADMEEARRLLRAQPAG